MEHKDSRQRELPFEHKSEPKIGDPIRCVRVPTMQSEHRILPPLPLPDMAAMSQLLYTLRDVPTECLLDYWEEYGLTTEADERKEFEQLCYVKEEGRAARTMTWPQYLNWRRGWFLRVIERVVRKEATTIAESKEQMLRQKSLGIQQIREALRRTIES